MAAPPTTPQPANWYPDPAGRFEYRWWDGANWTANVSTRGQASVDPMGADVTTSAKEVARVQKHVQQKAGIAQPVTGGGGTLFTEPILVVNQKAKIIEVTTEYKVFDQHGTQLGSVVQVGQSGLKKAMRVLTSVDQFMTHRYEIRDASGAVLVNLTRPRKVFKSSLVVGGPAGDELGRIVQANVFGKIRFNLEAGGQEHGSINAENWRAWNFNVQDATGTEVARITKTFEGFGKTMFTPADNYVVQIHRPLQDPLRLLVLAAALGVDTALKQDARGLN